MRRGILLSALLLFSTTATATAEDSVREPYIDRLIALDLLKASSGSDPKSVTGAVSALRLWIASAADGAITNEEKTLLENSDNLRALRQDVTAQLQSPGFKRKLVASGALDSTIEQATLNVLRAAARRFRQAIASTAIGKYDGADLTELNGAEDAMDAFAKFENIEGETRGVRIDLPVNLVSKVEDQENDDSWVTYSSADKAIKIDFFLNRGNSNTAVSLASMLLEKRKGLYFNTLDLAGDRFLIEASAQKPDNKRELVIFHGKERNGGVQGLGLRTQADPPAGLVLPVMKIFDLPRDAPWARTLDIETPEQTQWRIIAKVISNLLASDYQRLNDWHYMSTQDCKGVKRPAGGVRKNVNIIYATARKSGVALSDFVKTPLKDLYTSAQGSWLQVGCIHVSVPISDAVMASQELPAARSMSEKQDATSQSSDEFQVTIAGEPNELTLTGKDRLFFRPDEHVVFDGTERVLLFIHGYNNSFEDAIKRAAQIAAASDYPGYIYVFSWPSQGRYTSYAADMDYAEQGELDLISFMKMIMSTGVPVKLDIVAHSMGSQILLRSLDGIKAMFDSRVGIGRHDRVRLGQVIFAAPDVSTIVFKRKAALLATYSERITVYASANDGALDVSGWLRGSIQRVGAIGTSGQPATVNGVQMIDVTGTLIPRYLIKRYYNRSHNSFVYDPEVLDDIKNILRQSAIGPKSARLDPMERSKRAHRAGRFVETKYKDGTGQPADKVYWVLKPKEIPAPIAKN